MPHLMQTNVKTKIENYIPCKRRTFFLLLEILVTKILKRLYCIFHKESSTLEKFKHIAQFLNL